MASSPPGVSASSRAVLNRSQVSFLRALRRAVPRSIPLYVTSGTRTPEAQARALVEKRRLGEDLRRLYRSNADIADALMRAPNTTSAMASVIQRYMSRGRYLSRHMRGDAVDLRSKILTPTQRNTVMDAARRLGAKAIYETTPPHIHIERIGGSASNLSLAARDAAGQVGGAAYRQRRKLAALYTTSAVVGLLIVAALVRRQRTR
jgi:hypothetical protein